MSLVQLAALFIPIPVKGIVDALDAPVFTIIGQNFLGISGFRGMIGYTIDDFSRVLTAFFTDRMTLDGKDLADTGEVEIIIEFRAGPDRTAFNAAVDQRCIYTS